MFRKPRTKAGSDSLALTKMRETWKPVVGHKGHYEVSNLGRVRSVDREVSMASRWGGTFVRVFSGRLLKLQVDKDGYLRVGLYAAPARMRFRPVHRLVAEAFLKNPKRLPEVDHKDSDRLNAKADNLQWVTGLRNAELTVARGRSSRGEKINASRLTVADVHQIRRRAAEGAKYIHLAREFGVSDVAVAAIVKRRTWRHV